MAPQTPQGLLSSIRSQSIVLPNLTSILSSYALEVNPSLERVRYDVDKWVASSLPEAYSRKIRALKAADFGYFGATWWPRAPYSRLRVLTFLSTWIFCWDDELDEENGELWDTSEEADRFRTDTKEYVLCCLGLMDFKIGSEPRSPIIQSFGVIGTAIRDVYTRGDLRSIEQYHGLERHMALIFCIAQCVRLAAHLSDYIDGCHAEEHFRQLNLIPSVEQFWHFRLRSSAVYFLFAAQEFALPLPCQSPIPISHYIMESPAMEDLWKQGNIIISTVNDMFSLKKEVAGGSVASVIPVEYAQSGTLQEAVDKTTDFLIDSIDAFERAAKGVVEMEDCGAKRQLVSDFVLGLKFNITGNLSWSLRTERYGILKDDMEGGVRVEMC